MENNGINVADCRAQAYDGAKVMSSEISGAATFIKKQQPLAEYTHCRSHAINLAISFACKNKSIQKFMDDLTTVCYFFNNSPKRKQYFELLINFYGEKLNLNETKRRDIIGLSKTRWVERYRAYENYYLLHKSVIATFESVFMPHLYNEFYAYLEDKFEEKWTWDADTKTKAQGLYAACPSFAHIVAFSVLFNGLEPLKPLVVKLQKRNQDIFKGYYIIDTIVSDLMDYRRNVDKGFSI